MNLLTNYPDELVHITAKLLQNSYPDDMYPYCSGISCSNCIAYDSTSDRSFCKIENWCSENAKHVIDNANDIVWRTFADAFLNTFTLQKYPHLYV